MKRLAPFLCFGLILSLMPAIGFAHAAAAKAVAAKDIVCGWRYGADGYTHFACQIGGHIADPVARKPGIPAIGLRVEDLTPTPEMLGLVARSVRGSAVDPRLVLAVIAAESAFDRQAVSPKNAVGLMQLMPETVARFGVRDPFDAEENIRAGTFYLQYLLVKYRNLPLALAAYNAGEGPVLSYGAVPPYEETTEYVARVLRLYQRYQRIPFERGAPVAIAAKAAPVKPVAAKPVAAKPAAVKLVAAGAKNTGGCALACRGDRLAAQLDELDRRLPVSPGDRDATWLAAASVARAPAN